MTAPQRALVVIDVQQDYFDGPLTIQYPPQEESLTQMRRAIDVACETDMPVVLVRHELPTDAPVFAAGSAGSELHSEVRRSTKDSWKLSTKTVASVLADPDVVDWLHEHDVDTLTLVGYMTNNCVLGTAAAAEPLGFAVEVLRDATGAIHLANEAGQVSAQQLHDTLMVLLQSNFGAVADLAAWEHAVADGKALPKSDLGTSAVQGHQAFSVNASA